MANKDAFSVGVGQNLKKGRESRGFTQNQTAIKVGCSGSEISAYEKGEKLPSVRRFVALCKVCDLDPGQVLVSASKRRKIPAKL